MAFTPVSLPIQEILLTNFVTDIATISNANDLLLQDKLEDLINNFEIDINALSIGTDNPINYVRAQSFIIQDTGFTFQTGSPAQIIARLEKNVNLESVLTVDRINVNVIADVDSITLNDATVNDTLSVDGPATFASKVEYQSSLVESKETVIVDLEKDVPASPTQAEGRLVLSSTSRKNIFVKLRAVASPDLDFVYDSGAAAFIPAITKLVLYIDFDQNSPPVQNTTFTIHFVDVIENQLSTSILAAVISGQLPIELRGGTNLNATPTATIYLHNQTSPSGGPRAIGINPATTEPASQLLSSDVPSIYGHNITLLYILDETTKDRLVVTSMVGLEFF